MEITTSGERFNKSKLLYPVRIFNKNKTKTTKKKTKKSDNIFLIKR